MIADVRNYNSRAPKNRDGAGNARLFGKLRRARLMQNLMIRLTRENSGVRYKVTFGNVSNVRNGSAGRHGRPERLKKKPWRIRKGALQGSEAHKLRSKRCLGSNARESRTARGHNSLAPGWIISLISPLKITKPNRTSSIPFLTQPRDFLVCNKCIISLRRAIYNRVSD